MKRRTTWKKSWVQWGQSQAQADKSPALSGPQFPHLFTKCCFRTISLAEGIFLGLLVWDKTGEAFQIDFFFFWPHYTLRRKVQRARILEGLSRGHRVRIRPGDSVLTRTQHNLTRRRRKWFAGKKQAGVHVRAWPFPALPQAEPQCPHLEREQDASQDRRRLNVTWQCDESGTWPPIFLPQTDNQPVFWSGEKHQTNSNRGASYDRPGCISSQLPRSSTLRGVWETIIAKGSLWWHDIII